MEEKNNEKIDVLAGHSEGKIVESQNELNKFLDDYEISEPRKNISEFSEILVSAVNSIEWKTFSFDQPDGSSKSSKKMICHIGEDSVIVPVSVVRSLKTIKEDLSLGELLSFKVLKKGSGLATEYTVVPLKWKSVGD